MSNIIEKYVHVELLKFVNNEEILARSQSMNFITHFSRIFGIPIIETRQILRNWKEKNPEMLQMIKKLKYERIIKQDYKTAAYLRNIETILSGF